jgi:hypothetical protein
MQQGPFIASSCRRLTLTLMTHVFERIFLTCPYVSAREYLREALQAASLGAPVLPDTLPRNVLVRYERGHDPMRFDEPWRVSWTSEEGGPDPDFSGEIAVRADEAYRHAVLEIHGDYAPPIRAIEEPLDLVLGAKIAAQTARTLLAQIGAEFDARYEQEQAANV